MNVKFSEAREGDTVEVVGFDCMDGLRTIHTDNRHRLYVECSKGKHFLIGQEDEEGYLVGILKP